MMLPTNTENLVKIMQWICPKLSEIYSFGVPHLYPCINGVQYGGLHHTIFYHIQPVVPVGVKKL